MERGEASRAKRDPLPSPNQIREIVMDSDSAEEECNAFSTEDEEVVPRPPSPASASSQTPSSSTATTHALDAALMAPKAFSAHFHRGIQKAKEVDQHISLESPHHLACCCSSSWK
jgi:hypothetical protein